MSKPLALPVVPIVLHPTRSSVVWAVGSRIFAYDLQLKAFEAKAADLETLGPVRALDVWQGEGKLLWLAAGDDKTVTTWLDDGNHESSWQIHETLSHQKKLTRAIFDRKGRIILADRFGDVCRWTPSSDQEPEMLSSHFAIVTALVLTPSQRFLVVGDNHERLRISHYPEVAEIRSFCLGHLMQITAVSVTETESILSASADGTLRLWSLEGDQQQSWTMGAPISSLCYRKGIAVLGSEAPQAQLLRLPLDNAQDIPASVEVLLSEAPQAVCFLDDGSLLWIDRRGHLRLPSGDGTWMDVSMGEDLPPALVTLSKNAGDAEVDAEEEADGAKQSKKKRRGE